VVTPPEDDALCSERVSRLPGVVFCFAPETDYPLPNWDAPEFLARPVTFGSFNNVPKLTPRTLALWARVLSEVPGSRLVLKAPSLVTLARCVPSASAWLRSALILRGWNSAAR